MFFFAEQCTPIVSSVCFHILLIVVPASFRAHDDGKSDTETRQSKCQPELQNAATYLLGAVLLGLSVPGSPIDLYLGLFVGWTTRRPFAITGDHSE